MAPSMSSQDSAEEEERPDRELRSEFLRGQMRHWMDQVVAAGRTRELFELEMWLRAFERFFRVKNQPLSEREAKHLALRDALEDLHVLLMDLVRLSRIPYATFTSVGRILYREIRRSHLLALLIDRKFKAIHDRITNPAVGAIVRGIHDGGARRQAAKVFLELFRLLHYLDFADPERVAEDE